MIPKVQFFLLIELSVFFQLKEKSWPLLRKPALVLKVISLKEI
jgi:hypothetical protein